MYLLDTVFKVKFNNITNHPLQQIPVLHQRDEISAIFDTLINNKNKC